MIECVQVEVKDMETAPTEGHCLAIKRRSRDIQEAYLGDHGCKLVEDLLQLPDSRLKSQGKHGSFGQPGAHQTNTLLGTCTFFS